MNEKQLSTTFLKNRAEQLPDDLWESYVLPLKYNSFNLLQRSRSTHIVGGRGTGKTMYMKYHCFQTILSKKKKTIKKEELESIGIYWRPDTSFSNLIQEDYVGKHWGGIFNTYVGLSIISELSKFTKTLIESNFEDISLKKDLIELTIDSKFLKFLNLDRDIKFIELEEICKSLRSELNDWLNYPMDKPPVVFAGMEKISFLIEYVLKEKIQHLKNTCFHIYIDEFENMSDLQQEIVNSWMKHSSKSLVFHVAYKKYYNTHNRTSGREHITPVHDYEIIDLETQVYYNFHIFSAEVVLSKIQKFYKEELGLECDIIKYNLSSVEHLEYRNTGSYQKEILNKIRKILPTYKFDKLAEIVFDDNELMYKIKRLVTPVLKDTEFNISDFIDKNRLKESIVNSVLLNRDRFKTDPSKLLKIFKENNSSYKNLVNNTFLGALLFLYTSYTSKTCPYFGGFNRFIKMAKNNVRHLLELCHKSFIEFESESFKFPSFDNLVISTELQAIAAKNVSDFELEKKVKDLSIYGIKIKQLVERLGDIYLLSQKQPSQSEPEKNHFCVIGKDIENNSNEDLMALIYEAKLWTIIVPKHNTKRKNILDSSLVEYHLHPIFTPSIGISPRSKRKFEFSFDDIEKIFTGDSDEFQEVFKRYATNIEKNRLNVPIKKGRKNIDVNLLDFI